MKAIRPVVRQFYYLVNFCSVVSLLFYDSICLIAISTRAASTDADVELETG